MASIRANPAGLLADWIRTRSPGIVSRVSLIFLS
jgi:hypothetical protein